MIMKKIVCFALNAAMALSLCACASSGGTVSDAETEGGTPFVEVLDPFLETGGGGTDSEEDDGFNYLREMNPGLFTEDYIDFEKHNVSSTSIDNLQVKANGESCSEEAPVTYRGGEMEISFTATVDTPANDHSDGYMVFIDGTPQIISLNGSEPSDMAIIEGKNGDTEERTIRFTPRLTKENIADKDDLGLTLIAMDNPLYTAFGTVAHFDFNYRKAFKHFPFKLEGDCETIELAFGKSFENYVYRDSEVINYLPVNPSELESDTKELMPVYFDLCSTTKEKPVIRDGKADITLVLYGGKQTTPLPYKVYFYVNHEPVKIDGCDYIAAELKYGFAAKYTTTVDNLKDGDIVYAIAIAENIFSVDGIYRDDWVEPTVTKRLLAAD